MRHRLVVPVGAAAVVLIGLGAWALWASQEPAIAVPDRVCADALPGGPVRGLLPGHGEGFDEDLFGSSSATSVSTPWKCTLSAGGQSVQLSEFLILSEDDYSSQDIVRDAAKSGNIPLSWGAQKGFIEGNTVSLYVGCESAEGRPVLLETHTGISEGRTRLKDRSVQEAVTALAADFTRFTSARVDHCKPVELPDSAPKIG
ncbi:hypothetical protein [Streptomyces sp. NPDC005752]|uniref:hypothetical protein n=1 Tax=Streptomyces sp. NPDC005752 TaxID=3157065 RepID=UPI0033EC3D92